MGEGIEGIYEPFPGFPRTMLKGIQISICSRGRIGTNPVYEGTTLNIQTETDNPRKNANGLPVELGDDVITSSPTWDTWEGNVHTAPPHL